ncbi:response regulator [Candidatus Kaiserbacteria bacterium]|nr:response regulator [Candidatus Kaiserbacteria bacterium]
MENTKKPKILIIEVIEDETSQRKALAEKFTREGYHVLEAKDGEEGLKIALAEHPDIILLDLMMTQMDGMTMLKKLRQQNSWGESVPVILLTNLSADNDKLIQGVADTSPAYYLMKADWTINDVVEKVRERLSREVPTA